VAGYAALLLIELHFPDAGSLKAKRRELAPVKAALRQRLGCTVAEVDHHDLWQRATLAAAVTGGTVAQVDEAADRVRRFLDERFPQGVRMGRTVLSFDDLGGIG
jgi:uncharacterized protein YlxP (DUF503 family)